MGKQMPKMPAVVVNAIRNLREVHGSTSKEILNYITSQHSAPEATVQRQVSTPIISFCTLLQLQNPSNKYAQNVHLDD